MAEGANPDEILAGYEKLQGAEQMLGLARESLDDLVGMGQNVTMEDLVVAAGKLVGAGLTPGAMAAMLADAPQDNPEMLAEWLAQRDVEITQREAQLKLALRVQRQRMGVAGLGMIEQAKGAAAGPLAPMAMGEQNGGL